MTNHRTDPELWERIKKRVMAMETHGTAAGQWSARKAQYAVQLYKKEGGGYRGRKSDSNPLVKWTEQDWTTKSGKPSSETGERYLPRKAIEALTPAQYAATSRAKREGEGQYVPQPRTIAQIVKRFR